MAGTFRSEVHPTPTQNENNIINLNSTTLTGLKGYSGPSQVSYLVLREIIRMRAILKENTANYVSLESLINVDFGKKYELPVSSFLQKKIAKMTAKMTMRHSIRQMN